MLTDLKGLLSKRTWRGLRFDLIRFRTRMRQVKGKVAPTSNRLHFGCGDRRVAGWLNVDVANSDFDVDLSCGRLPWQDHSFDIVVGQQVVEHLDLESQLMPLLSELLRTSRHNAELWISCPDIEKICAAYLTDRGRALLEGRQRRWPNYEPGDKPVQFIVNEFFHQGGEHVNLFDFEMIKWMLEKVGFVDVTRSSEQEFLCRFPDFPVRSDDDVSIYVKARAR